MPGQIHTDHALAGQTRTGFETWLTREGIPSKSHVYYRHRANQFIKSANGRHPAELSAKEVGELLERFGRDENLADWQFGQLVDAVRILLTHCLASTAAKHIDWEYWKGSASSLSADHTTTAREHSPDELVYLKVSRGAGEYADIRKKHRELIVRFVTEIRARGYAYKTEEAYEQWVVRYIAFCKGESPTTTGADHVAKYLNDLVVSGNVSASTQNQALNALIFLYKKVLGAPLGQLENFARSKRKKHVPVVMSRIEVRALLNELDGWQQNIASLLYGTGMRVMEGLTLRVKDIDFQYGRIHVCQAKGNIVRSRH